MKPPFVYLNDRFLPEEEAQLSYRDLSIQRGYGIFDFFRLHEGRPLFLDEHLDRFFHSAGKMQLPVHLKREALKEVIEELISRNGLPDCGIRLTLTGGVSPDGYSIARPNLVISQQGFKLPSAEQISRGIGLLTHDHQRQLPEVKTIDYLMAIWLLPRLREAGADDTLYHQQGTLRECPRANFFLVTAGGTLVTPGEGILKGITRQKVLQLAARHGRVEERTIRLEELAGAREAFITSSTKGILPVARIDDFRFSLPGPLTAQLIRDFREHLAEYRDNYKPAEL